MRRPSYVSWPLWKTLSLGLFVGGSISLMSWLFKFLWEAGRYAGFNSTPPTFPPFTVWDLLAGSGFLVYPLWNRFAWQLKRKNAGFYRWFGDLLGGVYLFMGGTGGVLFGMYAARQREYKLALSVMGILALVVMMTVLLVAEQIWHYVPGRKERLDGFGWYYWSMDRHVVAAQAASETRERGGQNGLVSQDGKRLPGRRHPALHARGVWARHQGSEQSAGSRSPKRGGLHASRDCISE